MGTAVLLPAKIEDERISLRRESLNPILPSPSRPNNLLKFSHSLFRRWDQHYLGKLNGSIVDPNNKVTVEVKISDESAIAMGYMADALHALEKQLQSTLPPEKKEEEKMTDEYEIYL